MFRRVSDCISGRRILLQTCSGEVDDYLEEEIECASKEATIEELTNELSGELLPGHPIM